jgi:hypothetical protein
MLRAAHKGYEYQDLLTAIRLVDLLLGAADRIYVDEKLVPDDRFDDLTTSWACGLWERCQFKFSHNAGRPLPLATFTSDARDCRLDRLVLSAIADCCAGTPAQRLFRLVVRDTAPDDDRLIRALRQVDNPAALTPAFATRRYQFDPEQLWPTATAPVGVSSSTSCDTWAFLRDGSISRDDLVWFCEHFVIEVDAPAASFDLTTPDAAEHVILRRMLGDIGAETYPNEHRTAVDVAAAFISVARAARGGTVNPTRDELIRRTRLRIDFGAVARAHPIVAHFEVDRTTAIAQIVEAAGRAAAGSVPLLLVGPPGAGKSWACQRVLDALEANGWLVAEHYCFLGAADTERDRRVAMETVIGSLLSRIAEADPALVEPQRPRFAADERALVAAIDVSMSREPGRRVALLVDGLDHVTRVIGATTRRPDPSQALAEELALLQLPAGSVLIVASQPGPHLEPLDAAGAVTIWLPAWTREEIASLAETLGIIATPEHQEQSLVAPDDLDGRVAIVNTLSERSAGNPLFATYLCRELLRSPLAGGDPVGVLMDLPPFDATLELYYEHLVSALGSGKWVADIVALLDFSVTRAELREMYPELAHRIDDVVELLSPVLVEKSAQGGIRVYHESFARYLLRSLENEPGAAEVRLGQIISWIERRGFFADSRAYRYLLPLRVRAGRDSEVVAAVDTHFVAKSVAAGFGATAISANLAVAAGSAGRIGNWPALVRYVELARSAAQYEFDNLGSSVVEFADVFLELLGPSTFAERLLYDGRTTVPSRPGLQLCAAADRGGGAAPWREYLRAFERDRQTDNTMYGEDSDRAVWLAWLRGRLRTINDSDSSDSDSEQPRGSAGSIAGSQARTPRANGQVDPGRLAAWLQDAGLPADDVIEAVVATRGLTAASELISCLSPSLRGGHALALAEWLTNKQNPSGEASASVGSALQWAEKARAVGVPAGSVVRLLALGVNVADLATEYSRVRLLDLSRRVLESGIQFESAPVFAWLDAVELAARLDPLGLAAAEAMLFGPGWYRCWLRFAVAVSRAQMSRRKSEAIDAMRLLTEESNPFVGDPRACDLYRLHGVIASTIRRALSLIGTDEWRSALDVLADVSNRVSTTMSGELGGPVARDLVLQLVVEFTDADRLPISDEFVRGFVAEGGRGRYYSDIARFELFAARLALAAGDRARATTRYERAMGLLVAYGWHKDITIYELLGPLPALIAADRDEARVRLSRVQPLCERVLEHTDGKETRHAPAEWWEQLVLADPDAAGWMLLDGLLASPNMPRPRLDAAREDLWRAQEQSADPVVSAALRLTLDLTLDRLDPRLLERLADITGSEPDPMIRRVAEWVISRGDERSLRSTTTATGEDTTDTGRDLLAAINSAGRRLGIPPLGGAQHAPAVRDSVGRLREEALSVQGHLRNRILISCGSSTTALVRGIREWLRRSYDARGERWNTERFANALGYRLIELYQTGASDEAATVLRMLADGLRFGDDEGILAALANGLELRGAKRLAVLAHVLAFTRSRGRGGWLTFGGEEHLDSLRRAVALDEEGSLAILPSEVERVGGSNGVTQSLVHAFAALGVSAKEPSGGGNTAPSALAFAMWDAAFDVIEARLPRTDENDDPDYAYAPGGVSGGSESRRAGLDAALAAATVAGLAHPGRERKRRGLLAVYLLVRLRPTLAGPALSRALSARLDVFTVTWLLELLAASDLHELCDFVRDPLRRLASAPQLRIRTVARSILRSVGDGVDPLPVSAPEPGLLDEDSDRIVRPRVWIPMKHSRAPGTDEIDEGGMESTGVDAADAGVRARADLLVTETAGDRLKRARPALQGLRRVIVTRVAKDSATDQFRRRMRAQLDHLSSGGKRDWPDAILASDEIVEQALQEIAAGGRAAFAAAGRLVTDPDGWEWSLAAALDDDPLLALAVEAARAPRPDLLLPPGRGADEWATAQNHGEEGQISTSRMVRHSVQSGDRAPYLPYSGGSWRVIGLVEHRYLRGDRYPHERDGEVIRSAALEARPGGDESGRDGPPLGYGDARVWGHRCACEELSDRAQPLVGMIGGPGTDNTGGWPRLGYAAPFLAPQKPLIVTLRLVPRTDLLNLALYDEQGCGLVYRAWRSLYETSEYELPRPSICGATLLLRPDLFDRLLRHMQDHLTWREHLVGLNVISDSTQSG